MALTDDPRAIAAAMSDIDVSAALDLLGPDSPLLPAVRDEHFHRLRLKVNAAPDWKEPA
ncbi:MAG: hypothetical protein ACI39C_07325 [Dietzia sp.]